MADPLYTCMTKAVIADGDQMQSGLQWVLSRRARLKLFDSYLECGDWTVRYADIRDSVLTSFRSHVLRIPGYVLSIQTETKTYHFGLNGWSFWKNELPFPVTRQAGKLRLSAVSFLARLVLIGYAIYFAWRWIKP